MPAHLLQRRAASVQQVGHKALELGARQARVDVLGALGCSRDEGQVDGGG